MADTLCVKSLEAEIMHSARLALAAVVAPMYLTSFPSKRLAVLTQHDT